MKHHLSALFYSGMWTALDWIFPPECAACGEPGYRLCLRCQDKIHFTTEGRKNHTEGGIAAGKQSGREHHFVPQDCVGSRHLAYYEGVIRECIHALKYDENRGMGELISRWLALLIKETGWSIDLIMPVPLSYQRLQERGYNQAALIAKPLAARLRKPYRAYGLKRVQDTPSQVGLSAEERRVNVAGAFNADPNIVGLKTILLVDDVMTTGSTLSACAQALLRARANSVYAVTAARHIDNAAVFILNNH
ncbi:MAG: ComF family protein [Brevefilum sp.]